jgi:glycosyltransferase involved in cell wall biosynthesis
MRIAIIAPPFLSIPPKKQGGTEAVLTTKIHELVRMGHDVTLFCAGEADFEGIQTVSIYPTAINEIPSDPTSEEASRKLRLEMTYFANVAGELVKRDGSFDVIFNHTRGEVAFAPLTQFIKTPVISIFHLPLLEENVAVLASNPRAYAISISNNQRGAHGELENFIATVYNGVEIETYQPIEQPTRDFVLWIGTVGEHKNTLDAIIAANSAGERIVLAGKIRDQQYHKEKILPLIDDDAVRYVGEISLAEKLPYLQNAKAVLFPTKWAEPFGLVMIEALACGTPVIAYPNGAVPEVITDKVGAIVTNPDEMAKAISVIHEIQPADCRALVEQKFSGTVMTEAYIAAAKQVLPNDTAASV